MNMEPTEKIKEGAADLKQQPLAEVEIREPEKQEVSFTPDKIVPHNAKLLPNCRITGIDYSAPLSDVFAEFSPQEIMGAHIDSGGVAVPFDLNLDSGRHEISCHPEQAGEFEIKLYVDVVRRERHVFPLKLTVNPDPKTLWKNIPSDQSGIYAKPDSDRLFLPCGENLSIVAASQRGRSHAQEGKPRDDDFGADWNAETECAVLVAADGAGSAKFSRKGSQIAVQIALEMAKAELTAEFWADLKTSVEEWVATQNEQVGKAIKAALYKPLVLAAYKAKSGIAKEAQVHEARHLADYQKPEKFTSRDYATTLILTVAKRLSPERWFIATFWIGDGGQGIYRPDAGEVIVQGIPDGGEFGGQTHFLTEDSADVWPRDASGKNIDWSKLIVRRLYFNVVAPFKAVVLMTDGVTDPKFETDSNLALAAKWDEFWTELSQGVPFEQRDESVAEALLAWMDFWSPGNHDDRTMMVLY